MGSKSFWLVHTDNSYITVGLCQIVDDHPQLSSLGQPFPWTILDPESAISAVDQSLSQSSSLINLPTDEEPSDTAFVISPNWLNNEGKIHPNYLKIIESICKKLDLKPLGFIPNDEAILESFSNHDGLPSSFVLVHLSPTSFDLSLIYLGKIKERSHYDLADKFLPSDLENALSELHTEATLPPQIIVFGQYTQEIIDSIKNYSWVGKKNIETFLHFPDVISYSHNDVFAIFLKVISKQFNLESDPSILSETPPAVKTTESLDEPIVSAIPENQLEVTSASDLGFAPVIIDTQKIIPQDVPIDLPPSRPRPRIRLNFPKIKFQFKLNRFIFILGALSPLGILAFLLLYQVNLTLSLTPYTFEITKNVELDLSGSPVGDDLPVKKKSIDIDITSSTEATGQKTIGEKAIGEVTIFNPFSNALNLTKGTVLTSSNNLKYELTTIVSVAGSSADYDTGTITMGQTKASVIAQEIGEEYNLPKDEKLYLKDSSGTQILAKVKESLTGGSKQSVQAISAEDKANVDRQIAQNIKNFSSTPSFEEINNTPGIFPNTLTTTKQRVEYNRQVGEEATLLEATSKTSISIFYLDEIDKSYIINHFFSQDPNFVASSWSLADFTFEYTPAATSEDKTSGKITVKGVSSPKIDLTKLSPLLVGKTQSKAKTIINQFSPRINDFSVSPRLFIFPILKSNIKIQTR